LHNKTFGQFVNTSCRVETNVANKEHHELGSSNLGPRCRNPRSISQSVLDPQCIHEQLIKAPSYHSFEEISGLNSPGESDLICQSTEKQNVNLFGVDLSLCIEKFSSNNVAESKKVFEIPYLHSPEEGILGSQPASGDNKIRLFGSNLCFNGTNKSFINQERFKMTAEVLGLHSPMGSTLSSQATLGDRNDLLFGSNLSLRGNNISYVNQDKSKQPSNVSALHSLRESYTASQPTPGNKIIRLFGSNLCPDGGNVSYINPHKSKQTSKYLFGNKTSLCLSPSPSSHKISFEVEDDHPMEVDQVSDVGYHMSYHQGISNNEGETGHVGAEHQIGSVIFLTKKVDLTSPKSLYSITAEPTNLASTIEVNQDSNSIEILQAISLVQRLDIQEISFTFDRVANPVRSQDTQEMSFTSDEDEYGTTSSHLQRTFFTPRSAKKQLDYDELFPKSNLSSETSTNQETQDVSFTVDEVEFGTMFLPSHRGISEAKSTKRQHDWSSSNDDLFEGASKSQKTQEISFTSGEVEHETISSPHCSETCESKSSRRQRDSYESLPKSQLCYETVEIRSETVLPVQNVMREVNHDHAENEEDIVLSPSETAIVCRVLKTNSPIKQSEEVVEVVGDVQELATFPEQHVINSDAPAPLLQTVDCRIDASHKRRRRKSQPIDFPKDVRSLLDTGILDGCPVFYYDYINKVTHFDIHET